MFSRDNKFSINNQMKILNYKRNRKEVKTGIYSDFLPYEVQKIDL